MFKMSLEDENYAIIKERFFENFGELRQYFMSLVHPKKDGWLEKYCTETCKSEFDEDWVMDFYEDDVFEYFSTGGTMMSGAILNGDDNRDNAINYTIKLVQCTVDYGRPLAWGAEGDYAIEEVFPQDSDDIKKAFDAFIDEVKETEDCVDAYRIGLALSKKSMEAYDKFVSCCGSTDIGKEVNGVLYMFGCNYGH